MTKPRPTIECPKCDGTGTIKLSGALLVTMSDLQRSSPSSAPDLWRKSSERNITSTAFNNRLERLRKLGLVRRRQNGKAWIYSCM